jgi:peptide deformylase
MTEKGNTLKIYTYPDTVLKETAVTVESIDEALNALVEDMIHTMYLAPGIGLAANQVGELRRLIVFDRHPEEPGRSPCVLINPEIVLREGDVKYEEACLSVVDFSAEIKRSAQVKVKGVDRSGRPLEIDADGLLAICLQHEIDHLNGILLVDHVSPLKRSIYRRKIEKRLKGD